MWYTVYSIEPLAGWILATVWRKQVAPGKTQNAAVQYALRSVSYTHLFQQAQNTRREADRERLLISSYAYAVAEENADGGRIVTAPTCGASGIMPAVLYYSYKQLHVEKKDLIKALAIGGLFGNVVKANATISGADGGLSLIHICHLSHRRRK